MKQRGSCLALLLVASMAVACVRLGFGDGAETPEVGDLDGGVHDDSGIKDGSQNEDAGQSEDGRGGQDSDVSATDARSDPVGDDAGPDAGDPGDASTSLDGGAEPTRLALDGPPQIAVGHCVELSLRTENDLGEGTASSRPLDVTIREDSTTPLLEFFGDPDCSMPIVGLMSFSSGQSAQSFGVRAEAVGPAAVSAHSIGLASANWSTVVVVGSSSGALDTSFDDDGIVTLDLPNFSDEYAAAAAVQIDGQVVLVGYARSAATGELDTLAVRLSPDGTLDPSFGVSGVVLLDLGGNDHAIRDVVIQRDGRIVFAGERLIGGDSEAMIVRLETNGDLDVGFGPGGFFTHDATEGASDYFAGLALDSNGRILAAGSANNDADSLLVRLTDSGALDATFANGGVFRQDFAGGGADDFGGGVVLDGRDRALVAGTTRAGTEPALHLVRFTEAGVLDSTFGQGGQVIESSQWLRGEDLSCLPSGQILVLALGECAKWCVVVQRYDSSGVLDTSFGTNGTATNNIGDSFPYVLRAQQDGKVVVAGGADSGDWQAFAMRLTADGGLDSGFGGGGFLLFGADLFWIEAAMAIDASGRLLLAGEGNDILAVVRLAP